jgi:ATP-binding cassette, subfamily B, bacterial HlyB/CyaB
MRVPQAPEGVQLQPAHAVWLLSTFCTLHQKPFDPQAVARECIPPLRLEDFSRIALRLGLEATVTHADSMVDTGHFPFIVQTAGSDNEEGSEPDWLVLLQRDGQEVVFSQLGTRELQRLSAVQLATRLTGVAIAIRSTSESVVDPDAASVGRKAFGFSWFVPELLKHRSIWREVLLASLVLQLIALAFPLFTQAIIDKVVVHRTESTSIALAIGMSVFILFTTILTWIRQYLILHTGNRVDAVLGGEIFEHLFKLPPLYFQHRPTGVIAARLQGIETIREFVSSAAVTLVLDLPFLLIFVAIMFWYSVKLTLIVLAILALIIGASLLVAPLFQRRLNEQFLRAAANQAFLTEYVAGVDTVKSLQLEPQLNRRYRDLLIRAGRGGLPDGRDSQRHRGAAERLSNRNR